MTHGGRLCLGDVVAQVGRARRMLVTDVDLDDPQAVTACYPDQFGFPVERVYRASGLVLVRHARGRHA
jgi:hypothetical protein